VNFVRLRFDAVSVAINCSEKSRQGVFILLILQVAWLLAALAIRFIPEPHPFWVAASRIQGYSP
jgi:hypothetical protein